MRSENTRRWVLIAYFAVLCLSSHAAYAYIDPGSGSLYLQILLGGAAGIGLALKMYWHNLMALVSGKKASHEVDDSEQ